VNNRQAIARCRAALFSLFSLFLVAAIGCAADGGECVDEGLCGGECALGNSMGVGRFCSAGGGECGDSSAPFCTVDYQADAPAFCTRPCDPGGNVLDECGENALCTSEDGQGPAGCVPIACAE
jgi:hypothetical protein